MAAKHPASPTPLERAAFAFEEFVTRQTVSGCILLVCAIVALIWANSRFATSYFSISHVKAAYHFGGWIMVKDLKHWVNDGLMALFFLLVGLEIKREIIAGELQAFSKAILPIVAAIGGMIIPAFIFAWFNQHDAIAIRGWGIPMATDIAFAIGVLSLVGRRAPSKLMTLLIAIAIVDDIGAVLVIALFYSKQMHFAYLLGAGLMFVILLILNYLKIHRLWPYLLFGVLMWFFMLQSGVHSAIAGVVLAFTIPGRSEYSPQTLSAKLSHLMKQFDQIQDSKDKHPPENEERKKILFTINKVVREVETPLQRLEHKLILPVTLFVIPLFVLFNAGVSFSGTTLSELMQSHVLMGVFIGLLLGKIVGIFGSIFAMVKLKWAQLPKGVLLRHVFPMSIIAGIGFTMSIFIAELAYGTGSESLRLAKLGILSASLLAAIFGYLFMYIFTWGRQCKPSKKS